MKKKSYFDGQVIVEYAILFVCLVAALLTVQYYIKRAIQGRMRESADSIGEQYAPRHINSEITITQTGTTKIDSRQIPVDGKKFGLETTSSTDETTTRTGQENLDEFEKNLFD